MQYNYNYQTQACVKSAFNLTEEPVCLARNAKLLESHLAYVTDFIWDFYVAATSAGHSVEVGVEANSLSKPMFFIRRDGANTTQMRFYDMTTALVPPSQFIPPASCLQ